MAASGARGRRFGNRPSDPASLAVQRSSRARSNPNPGVASKNSVRCRRLGRPAEGAVAGVVIESISRIAPDAGQCTLETASAGSPLGSALRLDEGGDAGANVLRLRSHGR
jgi:hypothetical protein